MCIKIYCFGTGAVRDLERPYLRFVRDVHCKNTRCVTESFEDVIRNMSGIGRVFLLEPGRERCNNI